MQTYNAYDIFSEFYDEFIKKNCPDLHNKYFNLVKETLDKYKLKPNSILDCTCGTGILAKKLKDEGYSIQGLDINNNMLKKAQEKGLEVFTGDIRSFNLNHKYDLIFSFDSLGHITTKEDLIKTFKNISQHLNEGGIFIFDGGTKNKALAMINNTYTFDSDKYSFIWKNYKNNDTIQVEISIDIKSNNEMPIKVVEKFELCGHDVNEIEEALNETDLTINFITTEPLIKTGSFVCCCRK